MKSSYILNENDALELLRSFLEEALSFLNVPQSKYPQIFRKSPLNCKDMIEIDYEDGKIFVAISLLMTLIRINPNSDNDSPSVYRIHGYRLARMWQRFLKTGQCTHNVVKDKDSYVFATALALIKGVPIFCNDSNPKLVVEMSNIIGMDVRDKRPILNMLKDEFGLECELKNAVVDSSKEINPMLTLTPIARQKYVDDRMLLMQKSISKHLCQICDGEKGSRSNPFENVDEAANYIKNIEKQRLQCDPYRQLIDHEQYFFDPTHGQFRISWASANVGYYSLGTDETSFVVNQLDSSRFSIKPSLHNKKFLYRGQSQYFSPCVPSLFRGKEKSNYVDDIIQMDEMQVLLQQYPLVKLFEQGVDLMHEHLQIKVNYTGLSQHYYNKTNLLDLTSDIDVAKFFAVTYFNMDKDSYEKYSGNELGVLYYYDLEPDAFQTRIGRNYIIDVIGKQPFMRSGNQSGFLIGLDKGVDFNTLPEVGIVFFKHDKSITDRIFRDAENGDKYLPHEILRKHWYERMNNPKKMKEISAAAVKLNYQRNKPTSHNKIVKELRNKGFHITNKEPRFTSSEMDEYYDSIQGIWKDFCSNIYFYSPEGNLLKKHLIDLPNKPEYRWAFYKK